MLRFFRDGFYKDLILLLVLTIIVGTVFSQGIAWAIDAYFGDTLDEMIGEYGEYDLILHIRDEAKEAALRELERIGEQSFPGYKLNETLSIAGQANIFFGLPNEYRTREVLESITSYFGAVPGLNGYTLVVEPSVLIRGVHSAVREELRDQIQALEAVKFVVKDGANLVVVARGEDDVAQITGQLEEILAQYQILELRFPMGFEVDTQEVGAQALDVLRSLAQFTSNRYANVTSAEYGEDLDAFLKTLVEMRDFLTSYASKVRISPAPEANLAVGELIVLETDAEMSQELIVEVTGVYGDLADGMIVQGSPVQSTDRVVQSGFRYQGEGECGEFIGEVEIENERYRLAYAVDESLRLLAELEELSVQASTAVDNAEAVLVTFQEALMQLEVLQVQMRQLNEGITKGDASSSGEQFLVTLLLNGLFQTLAQGVIHSGEESLDSLQHLDIEQMRQSLDGISTQIANVQEIDVAAIMEQIGFVRDTLPNLNDAEIGQSIRLINTYLGGQVIPGERVQLLIQGEQLNEKELEAIFQAELEHPYLHTYSTSVGMVSPDARGEIFRILKEVRSIVAGMLAIIFTMIVLVLDHAIVFSTLKHLRACEKPLTRRWLRYFDPLLVFGGTLGAVILTSVYFLARAQIPFVSPFMVVLIGFALGVLLVIFSERFSPVDSMELMAGQSLGLSNLQIMREVVIPPSRPGLLNLLNRFKQQF
ncbi:MAG: ABC transporter permease [Firmicutes bacterium]|nr:ABC transporter permease [Bacillota bacterium]